MKVDLKTGKLTVEDRKPKDDDFKLSPSGSVNNKLGEYEFQKHEQLPGVKSPRMLKVIFAVLKGGKRLWSREIAGNPWSPPPP